ncbi:uncharacterized protein LOC134282354 [Saccostrea cucullata]|uniref:uncharacterized protein LOC134282354 n=1 Tax=Saccostrea cuccullata TaxID=36930 RepID=UPI002ED11321
MMIRLLVLFVVICIQSARSQDGRCDGPLMCCRGFVYIEEGNICLPCTYPSFGLACRENCTCPEENCDSFKGCNTLKTTKVYISTAMNNAEIASELTSNRTSMTNVMKNATIATKIYVIGSKRQFYFPYFEKPMLFSVICLSMLLTVLFVFYILTCMIQKMRVNITIETMEVGEARNSVDHTGLYDVVHEN